MRCRNTILLFVIGLLSSGNIIMQAQTLKVELSPDKSKVDRSVSNGTATIFFDSNVDDLSIVCTDENPDEPIVKVNDNLWFIRIDVKKDIEADGICYRNFLLKSGSSAEYYLTTEAIEENQILYYTVLLHNELEPKLLEEKSKNIAAKAIAVAEDGDSYLARLLALQALPPNLPYTNEAEKALRKACQQNDAILRGHSGYVWSVSFSNDGKKIVSTSFDNTLRIWDADTGYSLQTLKGHGKEVYSASFSPDGKHVVSSSRDSTLRIWDALSGKCLHVIKCSDFALSVTYSPDGNSIVSSFWGNTINIWNANTRICLMTLEGHTSPVSSVAFSSDGHYVVSTSTDKTMRIWDSNTGVCIHIIDLLSELFSAEFNPEMNLVVVASRDKVVRVWDLRTKKISKNLKGHTGVVECVTFSPDGRIVGSASADQSVIIWDVESGECIQTFGGYSNSVKSLCFSPDGKQIVTASLDGTIRMWDVEKHCISATQTHPIYFSDQTDLNILINKTNERFKDRELTPEEKLKFGL